MPPGGGEPLKVTAGSNAFETADGKWLYVLTGEGLTYMRPDGKDAAFVFKGSFASNLWTIGGHDVFFYNPNDSSLYKAPFGGAAVEKVRQFDKSNRPEPGGLCIGVSPDESYLIYRRRTQQSSILMLVDGFR